MQDFLFFILKQQPVISTITVILKAIRLRTHTDDTTSGAARGFSVFVRSPSSLEEIEPVTFKLIECVVEHHPLTRGGQDIRNQQKREDLFVSFLKIVFTSSLSKISPSSLLLRFPSSSTSSIDHEEE